MIFTWYIYLEFITQLAENNSTNIQLITYYLLQKHHKIKLSLLSMELVQINENCYHLADERQISVVESVMAIHTQSLKEAT